MAIRNIPWNEKRWAPLFFTIWSGQTLSWLGSAVAQFGLIWWITVKFGSATVLALATMLSMLPGVLIGPIAGALIDRWNRRVVMLVADGVIALASLWLVLLFWSGEPAMWQVYTIMVIRSLGGSFHWPANQASISLMVPHKHLSRIAGLNQAIGGAVGIIAPPLGALALQLLPMYQVMSIDVITAVFSILPLLFIMIPQPAAAAQAAGARGSFPRLVGAIWEDMLFGFRYIWNWRGLFWMLVVAMLINFFLNPPMSMIPILVTRHFQAGAVQLGWLNASWGLGLLGGGLLLGAWGGFKKRVNTVLAGLAGMSIGILVIALAPADMLWLAVVGFALAGIMNAITNGSAFAVFQSMVAPDLQGRVFTVMMSISGAISPIAMAIGGPLVDWLGIRPLYFMATAAMLVLAAVAGLSPVIRNLEGHVAGPAVAPEGLVAPGMAAPEGLAASESLAAGQE